MQAKSAEIRSIFKSINQLLLTKYPSLANECPRLSRLIPSDSSLSSSTYRRATYYTHSAAKPPQQSTLTSIKHVSYTAGRTATPLSSSAASLNKLGSATKTYSRLSSRTVSPSHSYTQSSSRIASRVTPTPTSKTLPSSTSKTVSSTSKAMPSTSYTVSRNPTTTQSVQSPSAPRRFTSIQSSFSAAKTPLKTGAVRPEPDPRDERTLEEAFIGCDNRYKMNETVMAMGRDGNYHRAEITFIGLTPMRRIVYGVHYNDAYKGDGNDSYFVGAERGREA